MLDDFARLFPSHYSCGAIVGGLHTEPLFPIESTIFTNTFNNFIPLQISNYYSR
jgi:hypothetical protein